MNNIDSLILEEYNSMKEKMRSEVAAKKVNDALQTYMDAWMYMNRYRNCDLQFYFDEELNELCSALNPLRFSDKHVLTKKKKYKICFITQSFSNTGGASVAHRFMLENPDVNGVEFEQYFLSTNFSNLKDFEQFSSYKYLKEEHNLKEFEIMKPGMSLEEKGNYIQDWILKREIDFVVASPDPAIMYALASKPAPVIGILSQDTHTYTIGPGMGDITFIVATDQVFKYKFKLKGAEHSFKVLMLPLHPESYIQEAPKTDLSKWNIPENATVSASTNMWKSMFGDTSYFMDSLALLLRANPEHHHLFVGSKRCYDFLENYLAKNEDIKRRIHYVGVYENVYSILRETDFLINSFPVSGGSDIEIACLGKPTIEFLMNRNLTIHGYEFLRSRECEVVSAEELLSLGSKFIRDPIYREELGSYLKGKVKIEFNKEKILSEKLYGAFLEKYEEKLSQVSAYPDVDLEDAISYEKLISYYNTILIKKGSLKERSVYLESMMTRFPQRAFAWIKLFELLVATNDNVKIRSFFDGLSADHKKDFRFWVILSKFHADQGDLDSAMSCLDMAKSFCRFDDKLLSLEYKLRYSSLSEEKLERVMTKSRPVPNQGIDFASLREGKGPYSLNLPLFYDY